MSKQQVKLNNWPFDEGEQAQLTWISSPFLQDKKTMIYAYFRANDRTEKLLVDWGTLPALAIQHYYMNGNISQSIPPSGIEEVEIKIYPNTVTYSERDWSIFGTNDKDVSRSFTVSYQNKKYILPLIEVVRSILAPNRFLLYRLFETNSFPQYFIEQYEPNKLHLDFSSQYHRKYTKDSYLFQLVWLLTNSDLRQVFENAAYAFINTAILQFDWLFKQPITVITAVKSSVAGGTILRIKSVKNKKIPYKEISFTHPEIIQNERTSEAKKYAFHSKRNDGIGESEMKLDEEAEGTTDDFDLIEMDNQIHEYEKLPKVTKIRRNSNKQRTQEDENTKRYFIEDNGRRSTADVGGNQLARGIENKPLYEIQAQGELLDFINVLKVLEGYPEVKAIKVITGILPMGSERRRFSYLDDGIAKRKYIVASIELFNGRQYEILEIERESRSLSMLILSATISVEWPSIIQDMLSGLVDKSGFWAKELIMGIEREGIVVKKAKHSKKSVIHKAKLLFEKLF
ncbi:Tn7-like element transposition protein TnsE [Bacillus sp. 123MFChir2]|uniref:Tn7-like element transposition protein TnsE n=1 Tax=Bacillus sp. 123MFChir2 TaxID=1169144 RepID=UPI00037FD8C7|nr:Tn7-like element transposition protein TnsE [Bacillus sp. 123MFChir2]